jgi:hypothetical protein
MSSSSSSSGSIIVIELEERGEDSSTVFAGSGHIVMNIVLLSNGS